MPLNPSFTIGQNPLSPAIVVATDVSTGSDDAITDRRLFVQDAYGTYLVEDGNTNTYTDWPLATNPISLDILSQDTAASFVVQWLAGDGTVLYTLTQQFCLANFGKIFLYYLVQLQGTQPQIPADRNYDSNMAILWTSILGGLNAISVNNDLAASQASLNRGIYMQQNQNLFF